MTNATSRASTPTDQTDPTGPTNSPDRLGVLGNEPTTLHETLLEIAEHLRETGDFNDRAYVAMCNVSKEAHSIKDDAMQMLQENVHFYKSQLEVLNENREEVQELVDKQSKAAHDMMKQALRMKQRAIREISNAREAMDNVFADIAPYLDQSLPYQTKLQKLASAIQKGPARQGQPARRLRSGRRF